MELWEMRADCHCGARCAYRVPKRRVAADGGGIAYR